MTPETCVMYYFTACKVAGVFVARESAADQRALIERVSRLAIPNAMKLLRKVGR